MDWLDLPEAEKWEQPWVVKVLSGPYSSSEKLVFMWINSFGQDGCWMTNKDIMKYFNCSERTVTSVITNLREGGELLVTSDKNRGRRLLPKRAPRI